MASANFTQIFGVSAEDLMAQGINPRRYAREHRDQIRQFAQMQRSQGIIVPGGRLSGLVWTGNSGPGPERQANLDMGMAPAAATAWVCVVAAPG